MSSPTDGHLSKVTNINGTLSSLPPEEERNMDESIKNNVAFYESKDVVPENGNQDSKEVNDYASHSKDDMTPTVEQCKPIDSDHGNEHFTNNKSSNCAEDFHADTTNDNTIENTVSKAVHNAELNHCQSSGITTNPTNPDCHEGNAPESPKSIPDDQDNSAQTTDAEHYHVVGTHSPEANAKDQINSASCQDDSKLIEFETPQVGANATESTECVDNSKPETSHDSNHNADCSESQKETSSPDIMDCTDITSKMEDKLLESDSDEGNNSQIGAKEMAKDAVIDENQTSPGAIEAIEKDNELTSRASPEAPASPENNEFAAKDNGQPSVNSSSEASTRGGNHSPSTNMDCGSNSPITEASEPESTANSDENTLRNNELPQMLTEIDGESPLSEIEEATKSDIDDNAESPKIQIHETPNHGETENEMPNIENNQLLKSLTNTNDEIPIAETSKLAKSPECNAGDNDVHSHTGDTAHSDVIDISPPDSPHQQSKDTPEASTDVDVAPSSPKKITSPDIDISLNEPSDHATKCSSQDTTESTNISELSQADSKSETTEDDHSNAIELPAKETAKNNIVGNKCTPTSAPQDVSVDVVELEDGSAPPLRETYDVLEVMDKDSAADDDDIVMLSADSDSDSGSPKSNTPKEPVILDKEVKTLSQSSTAVEKKKATLKTACSSSGDGDDDVIMIGGDDPTEISKPTHSTQSKKLPALSPSEPSKGPTLAKCCVCEKVARCRYNIVRGGDTQHLCTDICFNKFKAEPSSYLKSTQSSPKSNSGSNVFSNVKCELCLAKILQSTLDKNALRLVIDSKIFEFCSDYCKNEYSKKLKQCASCDKPIKGVVLYKTPSVGTTPTKNYCSLKCMSSDLQTKNALITTTPGRSTRSASGLFSCNMCKKIKPEFKTVEENGVLLHLCSQSCYDNKIRAIADGTTDVKSMDAQISGNRCVTCGKISSNKCIKISIPGSDDVHCCTTCVRKFMDKSVSDVKCVWCKELAKVSGMTELIEKDNRELKLFCTLRCKSLYSVNAQAQSKDTVNCDQCLKKSQAQYHLTMSDASVRNFCSFVCVMSFQNKFTAGTTSAKPMSTVRNQGTQGTSTADPMISEVISLADDDDDEPPPKRTASKKDETDAPSRIIIKPPTPIPKKNKWVTAKPVLINRSTCCRPNGVSRHAQTEDKLIEKMLIPIPVPVYIPMPMRMYSAPQPYPLPIPIPIPIPMFIPTATNNTDKLIEDMKEIQERIPSDPFEADLLNLAAAVAEAHEDDPETLKKKEEEDLLATVTPTILRTSNDEMFEEALSTIAQDLDVKNLDDPDFLPTPTSNSTAVSSSSSSPPSSDEEKITVSVPVAPPPKRGRGSRGGRGGRGRGARGRRRLTDSSDEDWDPSVESVGSATRTTRGTKRSSASQDEYAPVTKKTLPAQQLNVLPTPPLKPPTDTNSVLKFTYGINAWKQWVLQKNSEIEKQALSKGTARLGQIRLFNADLLQCTADEINQGLAMFVQEVRKPNDDEYAPDSVLYLCLGIQQYLYENNRVDNIFSDWMYQKFIVSLNDVLSRYKIRLNSAGLIVCRIEEEHLWEAKQLGAHSPHVLLNTLVYFNTKHYKLKTAEDHVSLSFSHIMKHWRRPKAGVKSVQKQVYLRYRSNINGEDPQTFDQPENTVNPLRCPVKLYEFYISKCPDSIQNCTDVFYLQPERSCVPDSPVWYSSRGLDVVSMRHMTNRSQVVREIQEAYLNT